MSNQDSNLLEQLREALTVPLNEGGLKGVCIQLSKRLSELRGVRTEYQPKILEVIGPSMYEDFRIKWNNELAKVKQVLEELRTFKFLLRSQSEANRYLIPDPAADTLKSMVALMEKYRLALESHRLVINGLLTRSEERWLW